MRRSDHLRVLIYSHDTFGLGHLRRCRAIAHALVEQYKQLSVLLISGSSIAGAFDFRARVDFIKVPSVIKLHNGEYTSLSQHIDIAETLAMRRSMIECAALTFSPDLFIVDKEPRGLRGELDPTLPRLKDLGCQIVLGLREVLDAPEKVASEWYASNAVRALDLYYDGIWVYGSKDFWHPLEGIVLPQHLAEATAFTGFIEREVPRARAATPRKVPSEFILVTAGGGGDGGEMMRQVMAARAYDPSNTFPMIVVLGPFMPAAEADAIKAAAARPPKVTVLDFANDMENLMSKATAVVSMGGYNTFCEILSFDKRALLIPRKHPRVEQLIRARRAAELGLVTMLDPDEAEDPGVLAAALRRLPSQSKPSESAYGVDLGGLTRIGELAGHIGSAKVHTLAVA